MQVTRHACLLVVLASAVAHADDTSVTAQAQGTEAKRLDLRLTLSSFLFRQTGDAADPFVSSGAAVTNASPVRRYFGDLRVELDDTGLDVDARVRQTTSERYQAGATAGGEYEIRTLSYKLGSERTALTVGRQYIAAAGESKVDGVAFSQRIADDWTGTIFGGAFPDIGSRSVETDYVNGVVPVAGGLGVSYQTPNYHGDLGGAAVYASDDTAGDMSRVFATSSGYWRPANPVDIYHFALVDVAGTGGARLTNGSIGVDVHPAEALKLSVSGHHVSTDILTINARNTLVDPDPSTMGIVQNDLAITRVSSDMARAGTSVALARARFELSLSGGLHRRPGVDVPLADGSGTYRFAEAKSADATMSVLDRRSIGGLRVQLAGTISVPLTDEAPNRSRGTLVRAAVRRGFASERGEVEADVMGERFRDVGGGMCTESLDPSACFGTARIDALQAGVLASWRIGREWLLLADTHVGYQDIQSSSPEGPVDWPTVFSVTVFTRVQWRYR